MAEDVASEPQPLPEWTQNIRYEAFLDYIAPTEAFRSNTLVTLSASGARRTITSELVPLVDELEKAIANVSMTVRNIENINPNVQLGAQSISLDALSNDEKAYCAIYTAAILDRSVPTNAETSQSIGIANLIARARIAFARKSGDVPISRIQCIEAVLNAVYKQKINSLTDATIQREIEISRQRRATTYETIDTISNTLTTRITQRIDLPPVQYDPGDPPESIRSHEYRTKRLRLPYMRSFFTLLSHDQDYKDYAKPFLERRSEFTENTQDDEENHRTLTAFFSSVLSSERTRELFNTTLDRAADVESQKIADALAANYTYVPTLIIGSGLGGTIYASELRHENPEAKILTIDSSKRLGGQFAEAEAAALALNSRTRPQDNDTPGVPGNPGNLNPLGPHAVVQLPDITGDTYATQEAFATAIRANKLMANPTLLNATATKYEIIPESKRINSNAKYKVTIEYSGPGGAKNLTIVTDQIRQLTGNGEEAFPFLDAGDTQTTEIISKAREEFASGVIPLVMHSSWAYKLLGDRSNPFPRRAFTGDVAVAGANDSAKTNIENLLGYAPQNRGPIQLDWPSNITWIGQDAANKSAYLKTSRVRYGALSLDFPRTNYGYNRIDPENGKVVRLRRDTDFDGNTTIRVFWKDRDGDEIDAEFDRLILATGYTDTMPRLLESLTDKRTIDARIDIFDQDLNIRTELLTVGAQVYFDDGTTHTIIKRTPKTITVSVTSSPDELPTIVKSSLSAYAEDLDPIGIKPTTPSLQSVTEPVLGGIDTVIARKIPNEDIVIAGVAARIPITDDDIPGIGDAFSFIGENTVADFFNEPKITELARTDAADAEEREDRSQSSPSGVLDALENERKRPKNRVVNARPERFINAVGIQYPIDTFSYISRPPYPTEQRTVPVAARLSTSINKQTLAQFIVSGLLENTEFPKTPTRTLITLRFTRYPDSSIFDNRSSMSVSLDQPVDRFDDTLNTALRSIVTHPDIVGIVDTLTKAPKNRPSTESDVEYGSQAVLTIPLKRNGTLDVERISIKKVTNTNED